MLPSYRPLKVESADGYDGHLVDVYGLGGHTIHDVNYSTSSGSRSGAEGSGYSEDSDVSTLIRKLLIPVEETINLA